MKPVDQLYTDLPGEGDVVGDCWRASLASILELPAEEVPHFVALGDSWVDATHAWLAKRGLEGAFYDGGPPPEYTGYAVATGKSPRGDWNHAVVAYVRETGPSVAEVSLEHDPFPTRAFLDCPISEAEFFVMRETR